VTNQNFIFFSQAQAVFSYFREQNISLLYHAL